MTDNTIDSKDWHKCEFFIQGELETVADNICHLPHKISNLEISAIKQQSAPTTIDGEVERILMGAQNRFHSEQTMPEARKEAAQAITNLIAQEANKATTGIVKALTNKGSHPAYHDEQMRYLETHWPTLYFELRKLITADKEQADE